MTCLYRAGIRIQEFCGYYCQFTPKGNGKIRGLSSIWESYFITRIMTLQRFLFEILMAILSLCINSPAHPQQYGTSKLNHICIRCNFSN